MIYKLFTHIKIELISYFLFFFKYGISEKYDVTTRIFIETY